MSETTPETAPAPEAEPTGEGGDAQAENLLADAVEEQQAAEQAEPPQTPDTAPASAPSEPDPAPPSEPAPEADDDWSDPEKGREAKRKANQEARKLKSEIETLRKQLELRVDPEESKAAIALVEAERDRTVARIKFGYQYGLPDDITDRLQGDTPEEIEADAKKLAAHFGAGGGLGKGGLDPTDEPVEVDPKKLAAQIPRLH